MPDCLEMTQKQKNKWFHKPIFIILMIFLIGPFALPLVWISPLLRKTIKLLLTILIVIMTIWMLKISLDTYNILLQEMTELKAVLK